MNRHIIPIDISNLPDLLRIAQEVKTTRKPRILKRDSETMAIVMPVGTAVKSKPTGIWTRYHSKSVREALKQSAGALAGVDRTQLLTDLATQRSQESPGRPI